MAARGRPTASGRRARSAVWAMGRVPRKSASAPRRRPPFHGAERSHDSTRARGRTRPRGSTNACRTRCASSARRRGLLAAFYLLHAGAGAGPNTRLQRIGAARLARRLPAALEAIRWRSSLPHRGAGDACRRGDRTWSGPSSLAGGVTDCVRAEFGVSCVRGRDVPARIPLRHHARDARLPEGVALTACGSARRSCVSSSQPHTAGDGQHPRAAAERDVQHRPQRKSAASAGA
jgi:hypothetical protein